MPLCQAFGVRRYCTSYFFFPINSVTARERSVGNRQMPLQGLDGQLRAPGDCYSDSRLGLWQGSKGWVGLLFISPYTQCSGVARTSRGTRMGCINKWVDCTEVCRHDKKGGKHTPAAPADKNRIRLKTKKEEQTKLLL
jgi:hypothetical protein